MKQKDDSDGVAKGTWGGEHVRLDVSTAGAADIEFDCAHGTLGKITPDADGNFEVNGTYVSERGGPVRVGGAAKGRAARYRGQIRGETLTLTVTLTDTDEQLGSFTLMHGKGARLTKCL